MISIAYEKNRYRSLLGSLVNEGDTVLEIGPHLGEATKKYLDKAGLVVLVDKSKQARKGLAPIVKEHDNIFFVLGDARSFDTIEAVLELTKECDVFAVDLGGGRFPDTVFKVWATWSGVFEPSKSLLRNRGLAEFIQRAEIGDTSLLREFTDNGWLSEYGRAVPYKLRRQLEEFHYYVDL